MKTEINLQTELYELNNHLIELINLYEKKKLANKIFPKFFLDFSYF